MENGMDQPGNLTRNEYVQNDTRVGYHWSYLSELKRAINDGADVLGYFAWRGAPRWRPSHGGSSIFAGVSLTSSGTPSILLIMKIIWLLQLNLLGICKVEMC